LTIYVNIVNAHPMYFIKNVALIVGTSLYSLSLSGQHVQMANKEKMKIEIWSDVLCPFCYIGKRHLESALRQFEASDRIEVVWKSFQLDPGAIPDKKLDAYDYLAARKGQSRAWSIQAHQYVAEMGAKVGLAYHFDRAIPANSFQAHRLIQMAKSKGLANEAEEALFRAYFTEGKDIEQFPILMGIGEGIGLPMSDLMHLFNSDDYSDAVRAEMQEARQIGVTGVPFFVFDRKYGVSGAQPVEVLLQYIEKAFSEWDME
jgi:predicted DsbA family dithiol-disulfide isomerase